MVQKRLFYDEETYSIPRKHPRQVEYNDQLISFSEYVPREFDSPKFHASGECGLTENAFEHHEKIASEIDGRLPVGSRSDAEDNVLGFNEEASAKHASVLASCCLDSFSPEPRHVDIYSLLLHNPPRKEVPIGPGHQADIPEWRPHEYKSISKNDQDRLMGTCVIPMPDSECVNKLESVKIECCCSDEGSIRCVKQHIVEARDKLERDLGKEKLEELGFSVMGEQVAKQWSQEEEELFYEVVYSNPMSMGKNFWKCLSAVFPSRTKMDIVSYYFNVFMLQKRAQQNRCKGGVCDSDDDEPEFTEDDEDSITESPNVGFGFNGEVRDDLYGGVLLSQGNHIKAENSTHWPGLNCRESEGHDLGSCNGKMWDVDYMLHPKIEVDLLSTRSMIEEVFGGAKARDGNNMS